MTRQRRSWWYGITPGGLIVTGTVALVTVAFAVGAMVAFAQGDKDTGKDLLTGTGGSLSTLVALQARNRPDPVVAVDPPVTVTAESNGDTSA